MAARSLTVAIAVCLGLVAAAAANPTKVAFPLYMQCDPQWGNTEMGVNGNGERATICREGCAMSCVSMALAGLGVTIDGERATPGTLNAWLEANNGYECLDGDCNNLVLDAVEGLTPMLRLLGEVAPPSEMEMRQLIANQTNIFVAHVHDRTHFVLLTGWDDKLGQFTVNDPFYNSTRYGYETIADVIVYEVIHKEVEKVLVQENLLLPPTAVVPFWYPLYKQCNSSWGSDLMASETICAVGCLMSSTSMALGGKHITVSGQTSNPGTLNDFLRSHGGYTSGSDMRESVVPQVNPSHVSWPADGMHTSNNLPQDTIFGYLKAGRPVIANVMKGRHFVLVIGYDYANPDTLYVNDPGFNNLSYSYSQDVVGWRLFDMSDA